MALQNMPHPRIRKSNGRELTDPRRIRPEWSCDHWPPRLRRKGKRKRRRRRW
jgi:hypothetical protein